MIFPWRNSFLRLINELFLVFGNNQRWTPILQIPWAGPWTVPPEISFQITCYGYKDILGGTSSGNCAQPTLAYPDQNSPSRPKWKSITIFRGWEVPALLTSSQYDFATSCHGLESHRQKVLVRRPEALTGPSRNRNCIFHVPDKLRLAYSVAEALPSNCLCCLKDSRSFFMGSLPDSRVMMILASILSLVANPTTQRPMAQALQVLLFWGAGGSITLLLQNKMLVLW